MYVTSPNTQYHNYRLGKGKVCLGTWFSPPQLLFIRQRQRVLTTNPTQPQSAGISHEGDMGIPKPPEAPPLTFLQCLRAATLGTTLALCGLRKSVVLEGRF